MFFGGDTGYTPAFADLGAAYGPFDLTVLPIGAYSELWPLIHMTPEEAVQAHCDLTRRHPTRTDPTGAHPALLVPVHWATFNLGFHPWAEPVQRFRDAADGAGVPIAVPRPGERIDAARTACTHRVVDVPWDEWTRHARRYRQWRAASPILGRGYLSKIKHLGIALRGTHLARSLSGLSRCARGRRNSS